MSLRRSWSHGNSLPNRLTGVSPVLRTATKLFHHLINVLLTNEHIRRHTNTKYTKPMAVFHRYYGYSPVILQMKQRELSASPEGSRRIWISVLMRTPAGKVLIHYMNRHVSKLRMLHYAGQTLRRETLTCSVRRKLVSTTKPTINLSLC